MGTLSESKKVRKERIKFVLLVAAFVALSVYTQKSNGLGEKSMAARNLAKATKAAEENLKGFSAGKNLTSYIVARSLSSIKVTDLDSDSDKTSLIRTKDRESNSSSFGTKKSLDSPARTVTMKSPKGVVERFRSDSKNLGSIDSMFLQSHGANLSSREDICVQAGVDKGSLNQVGRVEAELELSFIVETLREMTPPRFLEADQVIELAKIPPCQPFLADLKIINKLLNGYSLVSVQHVASAK